MKAPLSTLRVVAAQPAVTDLVSTVRSHARIIDVAEADLVVFPELSLTGYRFDASPISPVRDTDLLEPITTACARTGAVAVAGAPAEYLRSTVIAMLRIDGSGVSIAHIKSTLGGAEPEHFAPGPGPSVIDVKRWRIGLAICKETGDMSYTRSLAAEGVDVYACGVVHHDHELGEQERRARLIAAACDAPVVMASFAGSTGEGYSSTAGRSTIWSAAGSPLASASDAPGDYAIGIVSR